MLRKILQSTVDIASTAFVIGEQMKIPLALLIRWMSGKVN